MDFGLYTQIVIAFTNHYTDKKGRNLSVNLAQAIFNALEPVVKDIETGKYDIEENLPF